MPSFLWEAAWTCAHCHSLVITNLGHQSHSGVYVGRHCLFHQWFVPKLNLIQLGRSILWDRNCPVVIVHPRQTDLNVEAIGASMEHSAELRLGVYINSHIALVSQMVSQNDIISWCNNVPITLRKYTRQVIHLYYQTHCTLLSLVMASVLSGSCLTDLLAFTIA